ncbi:ecdysone-induced protein 74EF [Cherax quadricarinatus]|uniref:ecdysone-induced protein 74EF n=1 Tax=Cherax quadricarinatus TaxID=27406 RepID=UPI0023799621|nr:ecdysone-induced protein 74EF-like [Cherax quadricarinatus]
MLNSEIPAGEEGEETSPLTAQGQPTDPVSLARLHFLNAYKWSVPPASQADEYRVKWEGHAGHLSQQVARLEHDPASADLTVATKGASIPAHRIVLAAASTFFRAVLQGVPVGQHPVIVVRGADPRHLRQLVSYCYSGSLKIPNQEITEVLKLAEDLEIGGLHNVKSEEDAASSSSAPSSRIPAIIHNLHPPSPTWFTFTTPTSAHSSSTPILNGRSDSSPGPKRAATPLNLQDSQIKKRCKVEPLTTGGEELLPRTTSPRFTTPSSAPPHLSRHSLSSAFLFRDHSPPNSAPPQSVRELSSPHHQADLPSSSFSSHEAERSPLVSVVPPSRLQHLPRPPSAPSSTPSSAHSSTHSAPTSTHSAPSSPYREPYSPTSKGRLILPHTPTTLALKEPMTPSTPTTPTTPMPAILKSEPGSRSAASTSSSSNSTSGSRVLLWRFLLDLLHNPHYTPIYIRWLDRPNGVFRIMESDMVAQLWGRARKNNNMNYEKMSRGMRTYYKRGILFHIDGTKLIYKFNTEEAEIQQRMRYYDLTLKSEGEEEPSVSQAGSSFLASAGLSSLSCLQNLPCLPVSSAAAGSMESLYSPLLRDVSKLPPSLLYDPYLSFLRASQRELC